MRIESADFREVREFIERWVESFPEVERWKDFLSSSSGSLVMDLIAGVGALLSYEVAFARKEFYPLTAKLRTSLYHMSYLFGYPVNRSASARLRIRFIPNVSRWERGSVIGSCEGKPLSLLSDSFFEIGVEQEVEVVVGEWHSVEFVSSSEDFQRFEVKDLVDNSLFEVRVGGSLTPVVRYFELMDSETFFVGTLPDGVSFISGDGTFGRKLRREIIRVDYLKPFRTLTHESVVIDVGNLKQVTLLQPFLLEDSLDKIRHILGGYASANRRLVNLNDHMFIGKSYVGMLDVAFQRREIQCCAFDVSYIKLDESLMTSHEIQNFILYMKNFGLIGVSYYVVHPIRTVINLNMDVYISEEFQGEAVKVKQEVLDIFSNYGKALGEKLYVGEVVVKVSRVEGVSKVHLRAPLNDVVMGWNEYFILNPVISFNVGS